MISTMSEGFGADLIRTHCELTLELHSDSLPERVLEAVRRCMGVKHAVIVGVEGGVLGDWWVHDDSTKVTAYSLEAAKRALSHPKGWWRGEGSEASVSFSSGVAKDYPSCIAAKISVPRHALGAIYCEGDHFDDRDGERLKLLADFFAVHLEYFHLAQERKRQEEQQSTDVPALLGEAPAMSLLKDELDAAARVPSSVLVLGETGVGKEVAAAWIHQRSSCSKGPFVAMHCAAIPKDLLESELFGHEKGAFSGAYRKRHGRIELAHNGTLFLDEVGDVPYEFQVKLLRVLETKKLWPVGAEAEVGPLNFRLICATNRSLTRMVAENTFREDLYYRISGMPIQIPPLRERLEDIPLLASYFAFHGANPKKIEDSAIALLQSVQWPGNVRQLKTVIENARGLATAYVITTGLIEKQLTYQSLQRREKVPASEEQPTFSEIQRRLLQGEMNGKELQDMIAPVYLKCGKNLNQTGRRFNCRTAQELREFRNFIYYRIRTGVLSLPK